MTTHSPSRRARRPDSLASTVASILNEVKAPIATPAMRVILTEHGRTTTAEQLGRLAAYQREDFSRTHTPPRLCWTIEPDGVATLPRWWALSDWRPGMRIRTEDSIPIWLAHLGVWLTTDLTERPEGRSDEYKTLALGTAARLLDRRYFHVPSTAEQWAEIRTSIYSPYIGALSQTLGLTAQQAKVEVRLLQSNALGDDLLFGVPKAGA